MKTERDKLFDRFQNDMYENVHHEDVYYIAQEALRYAQEDGEYNVVYRERFGDDEDYTTVHAVAQHIMTASGIRIAVVRYEDITEAIRSTEAARKAFESSVEKFYENDQKSTCIVSREDSSVLYTNKAFADLLPPKRAYDSGINYWEYFHGIDGSGREQFFQQINEKGKDIVREADSESPIVLDVREAVWAGKDAYVINAEKVDEVYIDTLTGLANQAFFEMQAGGFADRYLSKGENAAIIFYDVANMKLYNTQNGYELGDKLLRDIADVMSRSFEGSLVARLHADHFSVITGENNLEEKLKLANDRISELSGSMKVEVKAGVKVIPSVEDMDISRLLDQTKIAGDTIRYDVEHYFCYYDDELEHRLENHKYVVDHIDQAISNRDIIVYYQPVIRTLNGKLAGFEALARWNSPELGFMAPYGFIKPLEDSHQIHKLDCFVIEEICREYREHTDSGSKTLPVSFNLSRLDFQLCDMFAYIQECTEKYQVPHDMLHIEITETALSDDDGMILHEIEKFHEAGYEIWMDDFGSGYSTLNALKDYEFDKLKIDMIFLSSFTEKSRNIISSIVQMAKKIGIHTLAEGVETSEQFEFLRRIGCEQVQGYYFGKPLPLEESVAQVHEKGIYAESKEEAEYVGQAGMTLTAEDEPFVIIEYSNDMVDFLCVNQEYVRAMAKVGVDNPKKAFDAINSVDGILYNGLRDRIRLAQENNGYLHFAFKYLDHYMTMTIEILSEREGGLIAKLTLFKIMQSTEAEFDASEEGKKKESESASDSEVSKETILIADDEAVNFLLLSEMLKDKYNILYAEDGARALHMIREHHSEISAVLLDMVMPEMSGREVLRAMRGDELTSLIPVIAMTSALEMKAEIISEGAAQFMPKPFEQPEVIRAKVENAVNIANSFRSFSFKSMDYLPGGVFVCQATGKEEILYANRKTLEIFECSSMDEFMELTGGTFKGLVYEDDYERTTYDIWTQIHNSTDNHDHVYYRVRTKSGELIVIDDFGHLVDDPVYGQVFYVFIGKSQSKFEDVNGQQTEDDQLVRLGATMFEKDMLRFMSVGKWVMELDEGSEPRLYCDEVMCRHLGMEPSLPPEAAYHMCFDAIDTDAIKRVNTAVDKITDGAYVTGTFPWYHARKGRIYIKCGGVRNENYKEGIRIDGYIREVTDEILSDNQHEQTLKENLEAIHGLASEYNVLHFLNMETDEYTSYFFDPKSPDDAVRMNNESSNYYQAHRDSMKVFCHPDYMDEMMKFGDKEYVTNALRYRKKITFRFLCLDRNGEYKWTEFVLLKFDPSDDMPTRVAVGYIDVDEDQKEKLDYERMKQETADNQAIINAISEMYFAALEVNAHTGQVRVLRIPDFIKDRFQVDGIPFNVTREPFIEKCVSPEYHEAVREFLDFDSIIERLEKSGYMQLNYMGITEGWCRITMAPVRTESTGKIDKFVFAVASINEEKAREERFQYKAEHDELTGLLNRVAFSHIAASMADNTQPMALMVMDIDHFKNVNDTYGHDVGDDVLKAVADNLTHSFRKTDHVVRYGGDEFVVIFADCNPGFQERLTEKIQIINDRLSNPEESGLPAVTVSAGIAAFNAAYDETVFKQADRALYQTKQSGRGGCTIYSGSLI